ncbi:MAG: hypothetical protein Q9196_001756 [Gyalolechia fulgens]
MDLIHVTFKRSGQFLEWNEVRPSIVQKSQSQQPQSLWACTDLRTTDDDHRLAIFSRRDSRDCSSKRPILENASTEDGIDAGINDSSVNERNSDSGPSCPNDSSTNKPDSFNKDGTQEQSNTDNHCIETQNDRGDHSDNEGDDNDSDNNNHNNNDNSNASQDNTANDANNANVNLLVEKVKNFITTRSKDELESCIRPWNRSLWEGTKFITSAQWHFDSLIDMKENDPVRRVIHKLSLHCHLKKKIKHGTLKGCRHQSYTRQYKDDVMEISPLCASLDGKPRKAKRRLLDLYLQQGALFHKLCSLCPGLMGLVAPPLRTAEYVCIDRNFDTFETAWKESGVCETASKFSAVVSAGLAAMPQSKRMNDTSNLDPNTLKRRRTCRDNGIATPPPMPPATGATQSASEENRYHPPKQSQQRSASRITSLRHLLIDATPPHSFGYKVSSGGCDTTNASNTSEMAIDNTALESFTDFENNPTQVPQGPILSEGVQYGSQLGIPPTLQEGEIYPQSTDASAVGLYHLGSSSGHTANDGGYIPWFPDCDNTLGAEAPGSNSGLGPTADDGGYIPWFSDCDSTLGAAYAGNNVQGLDTNVQLIC